MAAPLTTTPGIYVIEVRHGVVKVGLSGDTDRRIATHLRNARGLGADPYRWQVIPCPEQLLRPAERAAHRAVTGMGGTAQARTPEVFADVYYNPVLDQVRGTVQDVIEHAAAVERLRAMSAANLALTLFDAHPDVAIVARFALENP